MIAGLLIAGVALPGRMIAAIDAIGCGAYAYEGSIFTWPSSTRISQRPAVIGPMNFRSKTWRVPSG